MLNQIVIAGRLTSDLVMEETEDGKKVYFDVIGTNDGFVG